MGFTGGRMCSPPRKGNVALYVLPSSDGSTITFFSADLPKMLALVASAVAAFSSSTTISSTLPAAHCCLLASQPLLWLACLTGAAAGSHLLLFAIMAPAWASQPSRVEKELLLPRRPMAGSKENLACGRQVRGGGQDACRKELGRNVCAKGNVSPSSKN